MEAANDNGNAGPEVPIPLRERVIPRTEAGDWLLRWAEGGWAPAGTPEVVGTALSGAPLLKFVLSPLTESADAEPANTLPEPGDASSS